MHPTHLTKQCPVDAPVPVRKVFIAYQASPPIIADLADAFGKRGVAVDFFHADANTFFDRFVVRRINKLAHSLRLIPKSRVLFPEHPLAHRNFRSAGLKAALAASDADFAFVIRGWSYRIESLDTHIPLLGWWVEADRRLPEVLPEIGRYAHFYLMNESCVDIARNSGHEHVSYLPHAVNPQRFRLLDGVEKDIDVSFVGGWSRKRERYLEKVLAVTRNVVVYGPKWRKRCWHKPKIFACICGAHIEGDALNRLYNRSRIILNITNWDGGKDRPPSGINMRALEVAACGGFLLTDLVQELETSFAPATMGIFHDADDLERQTGYWLSHQDERESRAASLHNNLDYRSTYDAMVDELLSRYKQLMASSGK